jgi:hypothetical protein
MQFESQIFHIETKLELDIPAVCFISIDEDWVLQTLVVPSVLRRHAWPTIKNRLRHFLGPGPGPLTRK